jgi:hypothetical protein
VDEGRGAHAQDTHAREDKDGDCAKAEAERRCNVWSGVKAGRDIGGRKERDVVSKRQVLPQDEPAPESCLHCEINDLVQEHVEGLEEPVDIVALAANMAESLVDLILLAPEEEQAKMLAVTIGHLGHTFLEKTGVVEGGADTAH